MRGSLLVVFLAGCGPLLGQEEDGLVLNEVVDEVLGGVREELQARGEDVLPVTNVDREWRVKKGHIRLKGTLECERGEVGHLTTIHRTGDVTLTPEGNKLILRMKMGIEKLFIKYEECEAKIKNLWNVSGRMKAKIDGVSIDGQISLVREGDSCIIVTDKMELDHLGDIDIEIGRSLFQRAINHLLELLADTFRSSISHAIERKLKDTADSKLPNYDLCNKLPM